MRSSYHLCEGEGDDGEIIAMAFLTPDVTLNYDQRWILNRIQVNRDYRGQGIGTRLLIQICEEADRNGDTLWLGVSPDGPGYFKRLVAWYRRHGFKPLKRTVGHVHNVMVRQPRPREEK